MLRTQSESYEKNKVNDLSVQVCFDRGLASLLLFRRYELLSKYLECFFILEQLSIDIYYKLGS